MGAVRYVACASSEYARTRGLPTELDALLEPTIISENFLFLREAVLAGLGVGLVPDYVVLEDMRRGEVVTTLDAWRLRIFGTHMYMLFYMPDRHQTRAAAAFIEFILGKARNAAHGRASPIVDQDRDRDPGHEAD